MKESMKEYLEQIEEREAEEARTEEEEAAAAQE